jgi:hypothetical protein
VYWEERVSWYFLVFRDMKGGECTVHNINERILNAKSLLGLVAFVA